MQRWRESRLRELQNAGQRIRSRTRSPSGRIYGTLEPVDCEGYLNAVEKTKNTVVVVFIYDDMVCLPMCTLSIHQTDFSQSQTSNLVEDYMKTIAKENDSVRFVKLHYEDAEFESVGVPAVLAYKNAEKFAGLVPMLDELPEDSELSLVSLVTLFGS